MSNYFGRFFIIEDTNTPKCFKKAIFYIFLHLIYPSHLCANTEFIIYHNEFFHYFLASVYSFIRLVLLPFKTVSYCSTTWLKPSLELQPEWAGLNSFWLNKEMRKSIVFGTSQKLFLRCCC